MSKKNISQEKIIQAFLGSAFEKSAGATSLADVADRLEIKKASLYNHFESRESMYNASLEYCSQEINNVDFITEKQLESVKAGKTNIQNLFKKMISRYFSLFDTEPLFKMYVFVHSEQYFNAEALKVIQMHTDKITEEIKTILTVYMADGSIKEKTDKEIKELAGDCSALILQLLDSYIAQRKETVRLNPESGAGSLFELPSDNNIINRAGRQFESFLNCL